MHALQRNLVFAALAFLLLFPPTMAGAWQENQSAGTNSERYVVPDGDTAAVVEFIRQLSLYKPTTTEEDLEHRAKLPHALKQAAEKIIAVESDQNSMAYEVARFVLLSGRVRALAQVGRRAQEETLADVNAFVIELLEKGQGDVAGRLAETTGKTCQATGQYDLAAQAYGILGQSLEKCKDARVAAEGRRMLASAERLLAMRKSVPTVPAAPEVPAEARLVPLDIQPLGNDSLAGSAGTGQFAGNGFAELQKGAQTLGGMPFQIGDKLIRTNHAEERDGILKVEGIPVGRRIARLFTLHATDNGSPNSSDGTQIGSYAIRFEDGSEESIPIVYGEDVRDWWDFDEGKPVTRGRVVWTGRNLAADKYQVTIRLYLGVWKNPHPDRLVRSIDYISGTDTVCRPLCVGMTVEEPPQE